MTGQKIITVPNFSAVFAIIWGAFAANPRYDLFATNPTIFGPMSQLAPEWLWGALYVACGCVALWLGYTGRRGYEALTLAIGFILFATLYVYADPWSPAWALYLWVVVCNLAYYQGSKWNKQQP